MRVRVRVRVRVWVWVRARMRVRMRVKVRMRVRMRQGESEHEGAHDEGSHEGAHEGEGEDERVSHVRLGPVGDDLMLVLQEEVDIAMRALALLYQEHRRVACCSCGLDPRSKVDEDLHTCMCNQ